MGLPPVQRAWDGLSDVPGAADLAALLLLLLLPSSMPAAAAAAPEGAAAAGGVLPSEAVTMLTATERQRAARQRDRERTPASRVYLPRSKQGQDGLFDGVAHVHRERWQLTPATGAWHEAGCDPRIVCTDMLLERVWVWTSTIQPSRRSGEATCHTWSTAATGS